MAKNTQRRRSNGDGWVYQDGPQWRFKLAVGVDPVTGKLQYRGGRAASHAEATEKLRKLQAELPEFWNAQKRVANALEELIRPSEAKNAA